jgi:hypothetical protein
MSHNRRHDDPHSERTRQDPIPMPEEVGQNQPGDKGDGSAYRAGEGNPGEERGDDADIVRSRNQKPAHDDTQATLEPDGDLGQKRNTM